MEPAGKRRKFQSAQYQQQPPTQYSQRYEFKAFARRLHDAAVLISRQSAQQPTSYASVFVLLLRWQGDSDAIQNIRALKQVLDTDYRYQTDVWQIPTAANSSIKLGVQMASFLKHAQPNQLVIIYYSGHGYVGADGCRYWASSPQDNSAKLKWDDVRCPLKDAQSDILLLLDAYAAPESIASKHGVKQVIAACSRDTSRFPRPGSRAYFSPCLVKALRQLSRTSSFSIQTLCEKIKAASQTYFDPASRSLQLPLEPQFFSLTPDNSTTIELQPLTEHVSDTPTPDATHYRPQDSPSNSALGPGLGLDKARILVCTTFVGETSSDRAAFHHWLQNTPTLAAEIIVEGMFLGPPTMILISMSKSLWAIVKNDKVWLYLGVTTSRNIASQYEKRVGPACAPAMTGSSIAARTVGFTPASARSRRPSCVQQYALAEYATKEEQYTPAGYDAKEEQGDDKESPTVRTYMSLDTGGLGVEATIKGTNSAEMQEAAEQLKTLGHVRHQSGNAAVNASVSRPTLPGAISSLRPGFRNFSSSESVPLLDGGSGSTGAQVGRILGKPDICCAHCSHAPFKNSSLLGKHIAAAHTRPFPCAFSFGKCNSTFGSKNEWKRHMASQHLCLQFYRCSKCSPTTDEKSNEFNRKDLFTRHLHRMHAPLEVKTALAHGDNGQQQSDWDNYVEQMQKACLIRRRPPPRRLRCPKPGCAILFEGSSAWDKWTEHVGRHMEKGEGDNLGVDSMLQQYALDEGIIERISDNQNRVSPTMGGDSTQNSVHARSPPSLPASVLFPPLPPMEDTRCPLPPISKLLDLADAGSPTTDLSPTLYR